MGFIYDGRVLKSKGALEGMENMQSIYKWSDKCWQWLGTEFEGLIHFGLSIDSGEILFGEK
jgi:hypothetical protein